MKQYTLAYQFLLVSLFISLLSFSNLEGQNISFDLPQDFVICQSSEITIHIENASSEEIINVFANLDFPCQIEYVPSSISGAFEQNIADLNFIRFQAPNIPAGASISITLEVFAPCENLTCIDNADLFDLQIDLTHSAASTSVTSDFFTLDTPLPIITKIEDPILDGFKGETVTRKITIRNTRPGYLDSLRFIDVYGQGLVMEADLGIDISSQSDRLEILLTGNDFRRFGDGDDLFEFNEEIEIIETIVIDVCGFELSSIRSDLDVKWGCQNQFCDSKFNPKTALINIGFLITEGPILEFEPLVDDPCCLCSDNSTTQQMTIRNFDSFHAASTVIVDINTLQFENSGLPADSILLEINGQLEYLEAKPSIGGGLVCGSDRTSFFVIIPLIGPGEEAVLSWPANFCEPGECQDDPFQWDYKITYRKECTLNSDDFFIEDATAYSDLPYLLNSRFTAVPEFEYGDIETLMLDINSHLLDKKEGTLDIEISFDCQVQILEEEWDFNGIAPISYDERQEGQVRVVSLSYPLPLPFTEGRLGFEVQFTCDDNCVDGFCEETFISSCESPCESEIFLFEISTKARLNFDECNNECLIENCNFQIFSFDCEFPICETLVEGYLKSSFEMYRSNTGLPDNDNNHQPDGFGELNLDSIRLDRAITGDTIRVELFNEVVIDVPGITYDRAIFDLTARRRNSTGLDLNFQFLEYAKLMDPDDGFVNFRTQVEIYDRSSNTWYDCIDIPNFDQDSSGLRSFDLDLNRLRFLGCDIPIDYHYDDGDSINLTADYFIEYNLNSLLLNYGSIELEVLNVNTIFNTLPANPDDLFVCDCKTQRMEIANYKAVVTSNGSPIDCCFGESAAGGFTKIIKFGTFSDFFPYEYKPTVELENLLMPRIEGLSLIEAEITNLISNGMPTSIMSNNPSSYVSLYLDNQIDDNITFDDPAEDITGFYVLDLDKDVSLTWDDNLEMRVHFNYKNDRCVFIGDTDYYGLKDIEYAEGLLMTDTTKNAEHQVILVGKQPVPILNVELCEVTSFSDIVEWELELELNIANNAQLDSSSLFNWFYPISENGALLDFRLLDLENGVEYQSLNGIFQLGEIFDGEIKSYKLIARNTSCNQEEILMKYGWNCAVYENPEEDPCFSNELICNAISPPGVVDMIADTTSVMAPLCDTLPFLSVEIFNAGLGPLVDMVFDVSLPPGLSFAEGSAQIEFTSGTGNFIPIEDPNIITSNTLRWTLDQTISELDNGLVGVQDFPENSINLRFKLTSNCDFISGSRLIYTIDTKKICGEDANSVSKISGPIKISEAVAAYNSALSMEVAQDNCNDIVALEINLETEVTAGPDDQITIQLPEGLSYFSAIGSNIDLNPTIENNTVSFALVPGFTTYDLNVELSGADSLDCGIHLIPAYATTNINALCVDDNSSCALKVATGETINRLVINKPRFVMTQVSMNVIPGPPDETVISIDIINNGPTNSDDIVISLYEDIDDNSILSDMDVFLGDFAFDDIINSGTETTLLIKITGLNINQLCGLLAVIQDDKNCVCDPDEIPFGSLVQIDHQSLGPICSGDSLDLGVMPNPGYDYVWETPEFINCDTCPETSFSADNTGFSAQVFDLILLETAPDGCSYHHNFQVTVLPEPRVWTKSTNICQGEEATLLASDAVEYFWQGPGINNPTDQTQVVQPDSSTMYIVSIVDSLGCSASDTAFVNVNPLPIANAGNDIEACYGQTVQLSPQNLNSEYSYTWTPGNPFLLDPNVPNAIVLSQQSQTFVLTVFDGMCRAQDSVMVDYYDGLDLDLPSEFTICQDESLSIILDDSYSYNWTPSFTGMCQDPNCSHIVINPETSFQFSVIAADSDNCIDTSEIDINVIPVIDSLSQALICLGDTILFNNIIITEAGSYCDTLMTSEGCEKLSCIEVEFYIPDQLSISADPLEVEEGETTQLIAKSGFDSYTWLENPALNCFDCPDPIALIENDEVFYLEAIDINGCRSMDSIEIRLRERCLLDDILIPNAFTPNANDKNEVFRIANTNLRGVEITIEVYTRWGELLYESSDNTGWDGTHENELLPEGVYLYIITVGCDGDFRFFKGDVTLIR